MNSRVSQLQATLSSQAILLSNPSDITYYADFGSLLHEEREGFLIVTAAETILIQASFSPSPSSQTVRILKGCSPQHLGMYLTQVISDNKITELLIDESNLTVAEYKSLQHLGVKLSCLDSSLIWASRMVKDESELKSLTKASQVIESVMNKVLTSLKPGVTEIQTRQELIQELLKAGADAEAFPTIVAFGDHTALPHHQPTSKKLEPEMAVLIDAGAKVNGYRSDMTRTIWFGDQASAEFKTIEKTVKAAYDLALKNLQLPYPTAAELDQPARQLISRAGFGPQFNHTLGHGVGLDIHEPPSLNSSNHTPLLSGMVITVEPGIYLEGKFGYRFENTVALTEHGPQVLTSDTILN